MGEGVGEDCNRIGVVEAGQSGAHGSRSTIHYWEGVRRSLAVHPEVEYHGAAVSGTHSSGSFTWSR